MFYRVMPKCTLNGRGLASKGGMFLWSTLTIASRQRCWDAPTGNVPVRGWHRLEVLAPDYPLTAEQHSAPRIHAVPQL